MGIAKEYAGVIGLASRAYVVPEDVMKLMGCKQNKAYQIIRDTNAYAVKAGKMAFPQGKANKYIFAERSGIPLEIIEQAITATKEG